MPTQVPVYELEPFLGSEARLLGKGQPPLLHQHADVAELLHVVKTRQSSYHPLGTEPLQGLEVKVLEALVPLSRLVPTSSKAEGLCYLHVEDIESIAPLVTLARRRRWRFQILMTPSLISTREPLSSSCLRLMIEYLNVGM
jgi:hypothetical protein